MEKNDFIKLFKDLFYYKDGFLYGKVGRKKDKLHQRLEKIGYYTTNVNYGYKKNKTFLTHRIIYALFYNELPDIIDHIDRNKLNNKIENLRKANKRINSINTGLPKNNKTGYKGIDFSKKYNNYTVRIQSNGKKYHLGTVKTLEEAIKLRQYGEKRFNF